MVNSFPATKVLSCKYISKTSKALSIGANNLSGGVSDLPNITGDCKYEHYNLSIKSI